MSPLWKKLLRTEPETASRLERARRQPGTGMEPGTKFPAQRRLPHAARSNQAHRIPAAPRRRGVGRAVQERHGAGPRDGRDEEADRSAGFARRSLRVEHATGRTAQEQEDGRRRSGSDRRDRQSRSCRSKPSTRRSCRNCRLSGKSWDGLVDRGRRHIRRAGASY